MAQVVKSFLMDDIHIACIVDIMTADDLNWNTPELVILSWKN